MLLLEEILLTSVLVWLLSWLLVCLGIGIGLLVSLIVRVEVLVYILFVPSPLPLLKYVERWNGRQFQVEKVLPLFAVFPIELMELFLLLCLVCHVYLSFSESLQVFILFN